MKVQLAQNPIRVIRAREGKTIKQFAAICNVHYQALYLTECGVHPIPLRAVMEVCEDLGYNSEKIYVEYGSFVSDRRQEFYQNYSPWSLPDVDMNYSPIMNWRQSLGLTKTRLCKELCVQPALQTRLESGKAQTLYDQLVSAFHQIYFPEDLLNELQDRVSEYHFFIRQRR